MLIAISRTPVKFKDARQCTVVSGEWFGVYTGKTFTKASDVDIDHIVPLAHAHRHGADKWTRDQRRTFANDFENLLVVDDSVNQSKGDQYTVYHKFDTYIDSFDNSLANTINLLELLSGFGHERSINQKRLTIKGSYLIQ